MNVIFNVSEGPQYKIASTAIEGVTAYPVQVIAGKSELPAAGEVAGKKMLDDTAHRIAVMVGSGDKGLAETQVTCSGSRQRKIPPLWISYSR